MTSSNSWFYYALGAAVLWGIGYVLAEKLLRMGFPPAFIVFFDTLIVFPVFFIIASAFGEVGPGLRMLFEKDYAFFIAVLSAMTVIGGNFLIMLSVSEKNATLTSLIEISYPLFTFAFAWLILKEVQLTLETAAGAFLIFCGIVLIYLKS